MNQRGSFKVGDRVMFRGTEHDIFAYGDRPGTFDICQPGWPAGTDRWLNVPPDQLTSPGASGDQAHSKSEYRRRVAQGDPNVQPPADAWGAAHQVE